jgi:hypothetical protein
MSWDAKIELLLSDLILLRAYTTYLLILGALGF